MSLLFFHLNKPTWIGKAGQGKYPPLKVIEL
jgi:hypothetical protein